MFLLLERRRILEHAQESLAGAQRYVFKESLELSQETAIIQVVDQQIGRTVVAKLVSDPVCGIMEARSLKQLSQSEHIVKLLTCFNSACHYFHLILPYQSKAIYPNLWL